MRINRFVVILILVKPGLGGREMARSLAERLHGADHVADDAGRADRARS
jgi:hypothetical protein